METQAVIGEGDVLWQPTPAQAESTRLAAYQRWLAAEHGLHLPDYAALWSWSVNDIEVVLAVDLGLLRRAGRRLAPAGARLAGDARGRVVSERAAELRRACVSPRHRRPARADRPQRGRAGARSLLGRTETRHRRAGRAHAAAGASSPGIASRRTCRTAPETVVAFLACASIGAVWSSCAPDMGADVVLDRLRQIEPKLLLATDSYSYNGKTHDRWPRGRRSAAGAAERAEPCVHVRRAAGRQGGRWPGAIATPWAAAIRADAELAFERLPFSHPLWIVYSSGTTGLPKAMVHGHGGIVLTHLKTHGLAARLAAR